MTKDRIEALIKWLRYAADRKRLDEGDSRLAMKKSADTIELLWAECERVRALYGAVAD